MVGLHGGAPMTKSLKIAAVLAFCLVSLAGDRAAQATTSPGVLTVTAIVGTSCTIANATLNFTANYDGTADVTGSKTLTVDCGGEIIHWTLSADGGSSTSVADRTMKKGTTDTLHYQLYTDPRCTSVR